MPRAKGSKRKLGTAEDGPRTVKVKKNKPATDIGEAKNSNSTDNAEGGKPKTEGKMPAVDSKAAGLGAKLLAAVTREFQAVRKPATAEHMKLYMREQFEFFGIKAPERRAIQKEIFKSLPAKPAVEDVHEALRTLWHQTEREYQLVAMDFAERHLDVLKGGSPKQLESTLTCLQELIVYKSWWDTVDLLASNAVGAVVAQDRARFSKVMDQWIEDDDLWLRRTAILHQLKYRGDTNEAQLFRYCLACGHESEFFIQKAIGWALRQYSKHNPTAVRQFVKANKSKLSKLSIREASKYT